MLQEQYELHGLGETIFFDKFGIKGQAELIDGELIFPNPISTTEQPPEEKRGGFWSTAGDILVSLLDSDKDDPNQFAAEQAGFYSNTGSNILTQPVTLFGNEVPMWAVGSAVAIALGGGYLMLKD